MTIIPGELASREAAAQAGMDHSTIMASRKTAKDGAIAALQVLGLGRRRDAPGGQRAARLQAEDTRLSTTIVEQAIELAALHGNRPGAERPGSPAVPGNARDKLLAIIDECVAAGWTTERAYAVLGVDRRRSHPGRPRPASRPTTHAQPTAPETAHDAVISLAACRAKSETPQRFTRAAARMPSPKARPS